MEYVVPPARHIESNIRSCERLSDWLVLYMQRLQKEPSPKAAKWVELYANRVNGIACFIEKHNAETISQ